MQELSGRIVRITEIVIDLHPGECPADAVAAVRGALLGRYGRSVERVGPGCLVETIGGRHQWHRNRLDLQIGFRTLKRALCVENGSVRLSGNHSSRDKAAAISDSIDFVSNRLGSVARTDEIGANGMRFERRFNGATCRMQGLSNDLATVQSAPWIVGTDTDVHIVSMR